MSNTIPPPTDPIPQTQLPIELTTLPSPTSPNTTTTLHTIFSNHTPILPPIDGGPAAWRLLLAAFIFESLLWGFPLSFGVFQSHYASQPSFQNSAFVSAIGTTASGISYLGAPLATPLIQRWPQYRTHMILVGWPLCILGLVAASFATTLGALLVTQGVVYGVGFVVFYYPVLAMVDEFWIRRRGMAYGLLCSASGVSGAVVPLLMQVLLARFGFRVALRVVAVALVGLTGPLIPLLRGRCVGQGRAGLGRPRTDWSFLKAPLFWTYSCSNLCMGMGYFFPALFLPSYASLIGLDATKGALLLTLMSVSQVVGQFTFGYLSDKKVSVNLLIVVCSSIAAIVTLSVWGLARSLVSLALFAVVYGFFGAGYTAMWARMVTAVSEEPSASQAMFGLFCFGKGVGNILTGPISAGLLRLSSHSVGYGHGIYQAVVTFSGVCLLLSAASLVTVYLKPKM